MVSKQFNRLSLWERSRRLFHYPGEKAKEQTKGHHENSQVL